MNELLSILRDRKTETNEFRAAGEKLCTLLVRKTRVLLKKRGVDDSRVVIVIILRSGVALLGPALRIFPRVSVGVFGIKRDEKTFAPHWYYENLPSLSKRNTILILDPMLATGGTAEAAITRLIEGGASSKNIYFTGLIAAQEGLARLAQHIPHENIVLAAVDEKLDARKYIVPGLGDFGDRYFGY